MKQFSSWAFALLDWIMHTAVLNVLFLLCSLPVVTIGTSLTALCAGQRALIKKEPCFRAFFLAFRVSFWRSAAAWLILLPINGLLIFHTVSLLPYWNEGALPQLFFAGLLTLLALSVTITVFVFYSRFEGKLFRLLRCGAELALSNLPRAVLTALLFALPFALLFFATSIFFALSVLWAFFYFSVAAWAAVWLMNKPFIRFAQQTLGLDTTKHNKEDARNDY
ncbi:MAG: YesL family protein [Oscillospiraceae bacterium]|nr:YesL family protein [Oscillospiraceae bacterium]